MLLRQVIRCIPEAYESHRYLIEVRLSPEVETPGPRLTVILKNPSTAGATRSDPTIGKVEAWARRQNFGTLCYVNLFALRSTRPAPLNDYPYEYIVGPDNDSHIRQAIASADTVVAAWGNCNGILPERYDRRIREVLQFCANVRLQMVGLPTRQRYPRHGLLWNHRPVLSDYDCTINLSDRSGGQFGEATRLIVTGV